MSRHHHLFTGPGVTLGYNPSMLMDVVLRYLCQTCRQAAREWGLAMTNPAAPPELGDVLDLRPLCGSCRSLHAPCRFSLSSAKQGVEETANGKQPRCMACCLPVRRMRVSALGRPASD